MFYLAVEGRAISCCVNMVNIMVLLCCSIPCSTEDSKAKARTDCNGVVRIFTTNVQWNKRLRHICSYDRRDILPFNLWERNILEMRPFFVVGGFVLVAQWKVELLYRPHSLQLKSLRLLINEGFNCEVAFLLLEACCYCLWLRRPNGLIDHKVPGNWQVKGLQELLRIQSPAGQR